MDWLELTKLADILIHICDVFYENLKYCEFHVFVLVNVF